jgi:(S)-2-hydroxyglutarate dehydrogenase
MKFDSPAKSFVIVGGGIAGLAVALRLGQAWPGAPVTVIEKEATVGKHQSGHNSGVLHAGLYYKPGSLKARLAVSGIRQMVAFCQENSIPHEICGKLVVATNGVELARLRDLEERGTANGLRGLRRLVAEEMREIEPHTRGLAALQVPEEGIVDYGAVCAAMVRGIEKNGGRVVTSAPALRVDRDGFGWRVTTPKGEFGGMFLFNCAGLHCDRVLQLAGEHRTTRIVPFRGEYYLLNEEGARLVRNLIYPVPDPAFPFLGVHYTRMIHGGVEAGPNAVLATAREGYTWKQFNGRDVRDVLGYKGFWRFLRRYPSMAWYEVRRSLSKKLFCQSLQKLVPAIEMKHLTTGGAGVRAQAVAPDGTPVQDFDFLLRSNALHLINAPSPGATASLAIADHLIEQVRLNTV